MQEDIFTHYSREEWQNFHQEGQEIEPVERLAELVSLNDRLTQQDVREVYAPLLHYIDLLHRQQKSQIRERRDFFNGSAPNRNKVPFVIGISGSVAVGKSTVARVLRQLLEQVYPDKQVALVTTDGFLYPNAELRRRGIMQRKGFPESYDMPSLLEFMRQVKVGEGDLSYPTYSHEIYDVVPEHLETISRPDFLILEGINVFQLPQNQEIYVSDFFDLSLYIDAETQHIKQWFIQRYEMHLELAKDDETSYYYEMTKWSQDKRTDYANEVWYTINLTNLVQYIAPTKSRADIIINKGEDHYIDRISVRKY